MLVRYEVDDSSKKWWCTSHKRYATYIRIHDNDTIIHCCDPTLGGIMLPCHAVEVVIA